MIAHLSNFRPLQIANPASPHIDPRNDFERLNTLAFHIRSGDYFFSLSALLGFVEETLASGDSEELILQLEAIRASRKDLQYLQNHCNIEPRAMDCSCDTLSA